MKLGVKLTLQGLIRALQVRVHDLAEDLEQGQAAPRQGRPEQRRLTRGGADDIRRK